LLKLAGLPVLADANEIREKHPEISEYLEAIIEVKLDRRLSVRSVIVMDLAARKLAVGLKAIPRTHEAGIFPENILIEYYLQVWGIAPLFAQAYRFFLKSILSTMSQVLLSGILGPNRLSANYLDLANVTTNLELKTVYEILEVSRISVERPLVVGHGANGLLAKAVKLAYDPWQVSFEGAKLEDCQMAALAGRGVNDSDQSRIVNFYRDDSLTAKEDGEALMNNRFPQYDGPLPGIPPNPFQTFCFAAAACATDDRFDKLCFGVLGKEDYLKIWDQIGRPRTGESRNDIDALWAMIAAL
jgi:hypothetical protein